MTTTGRKIILAGDCDDWTTECRPRCSSSTRQAHAHGGGARSALTYGRGYFKSTPLGNGWLDEHLVIFCWIVCFAVLGIRKELQGF